MHLKLSYGWEKLVALSILAKIQQQILSCLIGRVHKRFLLTSLGIFDFDYDIVYLSLVGILINLESLPNTVIALIVARLLLAETMVFYKKLATISELIPTFSALFFFIT